MLQDYFKGASTPHQDYIKTSLRLIKIPSILAKDYLQAAKTPLKESFKTMSNVKIIAKLSLNSTQLQLNSD